VKVTDSELKAYLSSHKDEYQKKETKDLSYIAIDVIPSAQDTAYVKEEIERLKLELVNADNDSTYVVVNSDSPSPFNNYTPGQLPEVLKGDDVTLGAGAIVGPNVENGSFVVYKISNMAPSDTYSARASHILFKAASESAEDKAKAKKEARAVLRKIKNGSDFAEMARIHGTDGTKSKGGDLGWFSDGAMVEPFESAVYAASRKGLLPDVVESKFGYHIIDVTATKTNVVYKVATLSLEIFVSDLTRNDFYRDAEAFALNANNDDEFIANAKESGYTIRSAKNVDKNARRISGIREGRNIAYWAYNTANLGDVSDVFEIDNQYIIATLTGEQDAGVADLSAVRVEIAKKVRDQKKADIIKGKLHTATGTL
jgi:peptidyl-prolyl cis-trans isomerase D